MEFVSSEEKSSENGVVVKGNCIEQGSKCKPAVHKSLFALVKY